jgi:hypothetical protein
MGTEPPKRVKLDYATPAPLLPGPNDPERFGRPTDTRILSWVIGGLLMLIGLFLLLATAIAWPITGASVLILAIATGVFLIVGAMFMLFRP